MAHDGDGAPPQQTFAQEMTAGMDETPATQPYTGKRRGRPPGAPQCIGGHVPVGGVCVGEGSLSALGVL